MRLKPNLHILNTLIFQYFPWMRRADTGNGHRSYARFPGFFIFNQTVDLGRNGKVRMDMTSGLDRIFSALADPTRRSILTMLLEDDMAVTDVAEPFDMSLAAISKHLAILTRAGLISQEKHGRVKWCKLEPAALKDIALWMESFGQLETVNLDAFERFLQTESLAAR